MLMKNLSYFDRILNRYQSLPRWYGPDSAALFLRGGAAGGHRDGEPITATELARMKVSTPSAISQTVKKLDGKGLLVKDTQGGDRRTISLRLSESGRQVYRLYREREAARYRSYREALPDLLQRRTSPGPPPLWTSDRAVSGGVPVSGHVTHRPQPPGPLRGPGAFHIPPGTREVRRTVSPENKNRQKCAIFAVA